MTKLEPENRTPRALSILAGKTRAREPPRALQCKVSKMEVKEVVERELVPDTPNQRTGEFRRHFCDEQTSPSVAQKRKVSFAPNSEEIEPEMTELDQENLTLADRILRRNFEANRIVRQNAIEINPSACEKTDQSESENSDQSEGEKSDQSDSEESSTFNDRAKEEINYNTVIEENDHIRSAQHAKTRVRQQNLASEFLPADQNKKLSYRRETARQLRIHAQLTRCFSAVAV